MKNTTVVIGAGISGLAVSALLAKNGFNVTLVEKNKTPGGRAGLIEESGFKFDMGPSWYLMPEIFEDYFKIFGKKSSDYFELMKLDPSYKICFEDEGEATIYPDLEKNLNTFEKLENGGSRKLNKYLGDSKLKYNIAVEKYLYKPYESIFELVNGDFLKYGKKLDVFGSLHNFVKKYFKSDKTQKILEYNMVFLGSDPRNTPSLYSLMTHVDFNLHVWYPRGGIYELTKALESLCIDLGVNILYGKEVKKINIQNGIAKSILTEDGEIACDILVSSADYPHTEMNLLDNNYMTYGKKYWENKNLAPSTLLYYLGFKNKIKEFEHHNLILAKNWNDHFDKIFKKSGWPENPSYYVCIPSKSDSSVAPKDMENVFVLIPVATDLDDEEEIREKYLNLVLDQMSKISGQNLKEMIVYKKSYAHREFIKDFNSYKGSALGLAHTLFQSAFFRPKNKSKKVKNLYYTGQYTNPGIGLPIAIISARIVNDLILKYHEHK